MNIKNWTLTSIALLGLLNTEAMARKPLTLGKSTTKLAAHASPEQIVAAFKTRTAEARAAALKMDGKTAKTTTLNSRIIASAYREFDGFSLLLSDTAHASYTGSRGGDLNTEMPKFDTIKSYSSSGGVLSNSFLQHQSFDIADNITKGRFLEWNSTSGAFENYDQNFYTYYPDKLIAADSQQVWNGSAWEDNAKTTYTYTAAKLLEDETSYQWTGSSWENTMRYTYEYNTAGKVINLYLKVWIGSAWDTMMHTSYTYDAGTGTLSTELLRVDFSGSGDLMDFARILYTYDASKNMIEEDDQEWSEEDGVWYNSYSILNKYDASGNNIESIEVFKDDVSGLITDTFTHTLYTYNSYKQVLTEASETWNPAARSWEKTESDYYTNYYYEEYDNTSVKEFNSGAAVRLYPVPARDELYLEVQLDNAQALSVCVIDLQGRVMQMQSLPAAAQIKQNIPVGNLPSGNYFIQISGNKGAHVVKQIIVAH